MSKKAKKNTKLDFGNFKITVSSDCLKCPDFSLLGNTVKIYNGDDFGEDCIIRNPKRKDRKWFKRMEFGGNYIIWPPKYKDKNNLAKLEASMVKAQIRANKRSENRIALLYAMVGKNKKFPFYIHGVTNLVGTPDKSKEYLVEITFDKRKIFPSDKKPSLCTSWLYIGGEFGEATTLRGECNDHAVKFYFENEDFVTNAWKSYNKLRDGFKHALRQIFFSNNPEQGDKLNITLNGRNYIFEYAWDSSFGLKPLVLPDEGNMITVTL